MPLNPVVLENAAVLLATPPPPASCAAVRVVDASGLGEPWTAAIADLREHVSRIPRNECIEVTLVVETEGRRVRLIASTLDGRSAERPLGRADSLVPIALGLIAAIPAEAQESTPEVAREESSVSELPPADVAVVPLPSRPPTEPRVHAAVTFAVGGRVGFATRVLMADMEARADVLAGGWLILATARYAPFGARQGIRGYAYDEVALGLGVGRQVRLRSFDVDLTFAPELVIMTEEGDVPLDGVGGTDSQVRFDVAARVRMPFGTRWKPSVTVDADVAPSHAIRVDPALPSLPTWTLGMRIGAVGELL